MLETPEQDELSLSSNDSVTKLMIIRSNSFQEERNSSLRDNNITFDPVILFGYDLSHLSRNAQFSAFSLGVFAFTVIYGCLQELISIKLLNRRFGLFLATVQFFGYAFWSCVLTRIRYTHSSKLNRVPFIIYFRLSILRSIDVSMTNLSMQYLNYPAKTLIKSSRVAFTMFAGTLIGRKRYSILDYLVVFMLIGGLVIFLHADSKSAVFHPIGVVMLISSLMCDGIINNWSEIAMRQYNVCHDEFLFNLYSISFIAMLIFTQMRGELYEGLKFLCLPGTLLEVSAGHPSIWTPFLKIMVMALFCTTGLFGSSCAAAITKNFGALAMSLTSTARKAMTLFLSFAVFHNTFNFQHISGVVIFLSALSFKSVLVSLKQRKTTRSFLKDDSFDEGILLDGRSKDFDLTRRQLLVI